MCFSATASFSSAATLAGIGVVSVISARHKPHLRLLSATPFIFGIQQAIEGFIWLALLHPLQPAYSVLEISNLAWLYLMFANLLWPIWTPVTLYIAEPSPRRRLFIPLIFIGFAISLYSGYLMNIEKPTVSIVNHSITYYSENLISPFHVFVYAIATVLPFFISRLRFATLLGLTAVASCLASYLIWHATFASVWCFFAAALSCLTVLVIRKN